MGKRNLQTMDSMIGNEEEKMLGDVEETENYLGQCMFVML